MSFWLNLVPQCFVHSGDIINRIIFVIPLSDCSLLVYRNAADFSLLTLYHTTLYLTTLLKSSIRSRRFYVSLGRIKSYHLQTEIVLLHPFQFR